MAKGYLTASEYAVQVCKRKVRHNSWREAREEMKRLEHQIKRRMTAYKCQVCGYIHLAKKKR